VLELYFAERIRPKGLHAPRLLEAATCLTLAEKYRVAGNGPDAELFIARAVETHPAHPTLRDFEATYDGQVATDWRTILLPKDETSDKDPAS
jgi:hypothetical protein